MAVQAALSFGGLLRQLRAEARLTQEELAEAALLAAALCEQGRLDEAQQISDEAQAVTAPFRVMWQSTRARILARRGQLDLATRAIAEAEALISATFWPLDKAAVLTASAEVNWLAGAPGQALACASAALQIFEDRRAVSFADQLRAALVGLAPDQPDNEPT